MKKLLAVVLAVLMCATIFVGCTASTEPDTTSDEGSKPEAEETEQTSEDTAAQTEDLTTLRVGIMPYLNSIPIYYAMQQGWDVEAGVKFDTVLFTSGAPLNESIGADLIDVGAMSGAAVTAVAAYGAKLIGEIGSASNGIQIFVRPDSEIADVCGYNPTYPDVCGSPETVTGKQIIVEIGTMNQLDVLKWIEKLGIKDTDVSLANMTQAQGFQAFKSGTGDVIALGPPLSYEAIEEGWVSVATLEDLGIRLAENVVLNPKTYEKEDMQHAIAVYLDCIYRANEVFRNDPELAAETLKQWYIENGSEVNEDSIKSEIENRPLFTIDEAYAMIDELGQANLNNAEFSVLLGQLEADKLELFTSSVVKDYLEAAKEISDARK